MSLTCHDYWNPKKVWVRAMCPSQKKFCPAMKAKKKENPTGLKKLTFMKAPFFSLK